jgi:hypothetical protein
MEKEMTSSEIIKRLQTDPSSYEQNDLEDMSSYLDGAQDEKLGNLFRHWAKSGNALTSEDITLGLEGEKGKEETFEEDDFAEDAIRAISRLATANATLAFLNSEKNRVEAELIGIKITPAPVVDFLKTIKQETGTWTTRRKEATDELGVVSRRSNLTVQQLIAAYAEHATEDIDTLKSSMGPGTESMITIAKDALEKERAERLRLDALAKTLVKPFGQKVVIPEPSEKAKRLMADFGRTPNPFDKFNPSQGSGSGGSGQNSTVAPPVDRVTTATATTSDQKYQELQKRFTGSNPTAESLENKMKIKQFNPEKKGTIRGSEHVRGLISSWSEDTIETAVRYGLSVGNQYSYASMGLTIAKMESDNRTDQDMYRKLCFMRDLLLLAGKGYGGILTPKVVFEALLPYATAFFRPHLGIGRKYFGRGFSAEMMTWKYITQQWEHYETFYRTMMNAPDQKLPDEILAEGVDRPAFNFKLEKVTLRDVALIDPITLLYNMTSYNPQQKGYEPPIHMITHVGKIMKAIGNIFKTPPTGTVTGYMRDRKSYKAWYLANNKAFKQKKGILIGKTRKTQVRANKYLDEMTKLDKAENY